MGGCGEGLLTTTPMVAVPVDREVAARLAELRS